MEGRAVALGAGTVLNALATGMGSAFAIDAETTATVELTDDGDVTGRVAEDDEADTELVDKAARERAVDPPDGTPRPVLLEAVQYRFGAHTTADDPDVYRDEDEVERWRERDPLGRFEAFLRDRGLLDDERLDAMDAEIADTLSAIVDRAEGYAPDPTDLFADVYAESTPNVDAQEEYFEALRDRHGDDALLDDG